MCKGMGWIFLLWGGLLASVAFGEDVSREVSAEVQTTRDSRKVTIEIDGCRAEGKLEKSDKTPRTLTLNLKDKGKDKPRTFVLKGDEINEDAFLAREDLSESEREAAREVLKNLNLDAEGDENTRTFAVGFTGTGPRQVIGTPDGRCAFCGQLLENARPVRSTESGLIVGENAHTGAQVYEVQSEGVTQVQTGGMLAPPPLAGAPTRAALLPQTAESLRDTLKVSDTQWGTVGPALDRVLSLRAAQKSLAEKHLGDLTRQSEDEARQTLKAYKNKARENHQRQSEAAEALCRTLTPYQEAQLILLGVLD